MRGRETRQADHPRSRGVYSSSLPIFGGLRGSSPLARGLRVVLELVVDGIGIIPARAGFTQYITSFLGLYSDHPRSRGVYPASPQGRAERAGSSPLARGLHGIDRSQSPTLRIIPARAGFTVTLAPQGPWAPDHPRSRGVYVSAFPPATAFRGSSPLARGLRRVPPGLLDESRIIPARAGFTTTTTTRVTRRDHPRSRGVYSSTLGNNSTIAGSSPLARGLLKVDLHFSWSFGIIPARAGFTPRTR